MSLAKLRQMINQPKAASYNVGVVAEVKSATQVLVRAEGGLIECSTAVALVPGDSVRLQDRVVIGKAVNSASSVPVYRV